MTKDKTVQIRVKPEDKRLFNDAAKIRRQSLSSFLREVAAVEAERVLKQRRRKR